MLDNLKKYEGDYQISRIQIIREELEMSVLNSFSEQSWSKNIAFYGGTALRLAYDSPRYSEDIDLFMLRDTAYEDFESWVNMLVDKLLHPLRIQDIHMKRKTFFALMTMEHPESKHPVPLKIELFRNVQGYPDPENELRLLKSQVSIHKPLLRVATLEALKTMKIQTLEERSKARDIYDLWYIMQIMRQPFELPRKMPSYQKKTFFNELRVYLPRNQYPVIYELWTRIEKESSPQES